jgi:putative addiction module component (TIGR02574 family)
VNHEQLLSLALELPAEQCAELAGQLIQSLDPTVDDDVEAAWSDEIRRRLERLDAGLAQTIPWDEARRRIWTAAGRDPYERVTQSHNG